METSNQTINDGDVESTNLSNTSIEEQVRQRISECKELKIHDTVLDFFKSGAIKQLEEFGLSLFGIESIINLDNSSNEISITKSDSVCFHFLRTTKETVRYSAFEGEDEIIVAFAVNNVTVYRARWTEYTKLSWSYINNKSRETILAYIPGNWYDELVSINKKRSEMNRAQSEKFAENEKTEQQKSDIANFGL